MTRLVHSNRQTTPQKPKRIIALVRWMAQSTQHSSKQYPEPCHSPNAEIAPRLLRTSRAKAAKYSRIPWCQRLVRCCEQQSSSFLHHNMQWRLPILVFPTSKIQNPCFPSTKIQILVSFLPTIVSNINPGAPLIDLVKAS